MQVLNNDELSKAKTIMLLTTWILGTHNENHTWKTLETIDFTDFFIDFTWPSPRHVLYLKQLTRDEVMDDGYSKTVW